MQDVYRIIAQGEKIGLKLNTKKCEVLSRDNDFLNEFLSTLQGSKQIGLGDAIFLGAGLSTTSSAKQLRNRVNKIKQSCARLRQCEPHDAFWIVSRAAGSPKLIYLLRTSPCFLAQETVAEADILLAQSFGELFALNLTGDAWRQATLPANFGGLSLPSVSSLILPCFLSSTNTAAALVGKVLNKRIGTIDGIFEALAEWEHALEAPSRPQTEMGSQRKLLLTLTEKRFNDLLHSATEERSVAGLMCLSAEEAGAFMQGPASSREKTKLYNAAFVCALRMRLGQQVAAPSKCDCGQDLDAQGSHALVCRRGVGKHVRHSLINDFIRREFNAAGLPVLLEPPGLSVRDGQRPDGVTVLPHTNGKALAWDATCINPLAPSYV